MRAKGYDPARNTFVQYYGSVALDASLLMIPLVGFLPATDARMLGTVQATQDTLTDDGFVLRDQVHPHVDGLPPGELLAEQYDPVGGRFLGNFPQAFSHVGLVNTARNLTAHGGPAEHRPAG